MDRQQSERTIARERGRTSVQSASPELLADLAGDFPDPILIVDEQKRVVFLNDSAQALFGPDFRLMDRCPVCRPLSRGVKGLESGDAMIERCLERGESLSRVPLNLEYRFGKTKPTTVTASPIGSSLGFGRGCFVVLREFQADLLSHPVTQLQTATLSSILEHFPTPFFTVAPDLVVTHINEPMEKLTGYSRQEVVGKMTCGQVLNTVQCQTCECILRQVMEHKQPISEVRRVARDKHGRQVPVVVSASIITDPSGRVIGGFEAIRDITPLVEAQKKIDLITELTREGIAMLDEERRILFVNSRMAEIVGQAKEDLVGKKLREVLEPRHPAMGEDLERMLDQSPPLGVQYCRILDQQHSSNDEYRVYEACMAVARLGASALTCIYLRDLTNRLKIERELEKANNFLSNIIHSSVDGIVVVDRSGVPVIYNEGAERILGYRGEEVIGHAGVLDRVFTTASASELIDRLRGAEFGPPGKLNTSQMSFRNKNGEDVPVNFSASLIKEGDKELGIVAIFSDLRETLRMRKKLEETQAQLMQAEKIASLGQLAAGVAHEINNPLAGILIYAEIIQGQLGPAVSIRSDVEEIIAQTLRCKQIVTRLLEFSRQSLGQRALFDVGDIIHRCVELVGHQALFHDIAVTEDYQAEMRQVLGDPGEIQQVFMNLLLNAADAMDGQGRIKITAREEEDEGGVRVWFADTGCGIPESIRDKIFEPFFTTKDPGKGTGLGLSIVYGVIQRHGGMIEVHCPPEGGTTFVIFLPFEGPEQESFLDG